MANKQFLNDFINSNDNGNGPALGEEPRQGVVYGSKEDAIKLAEDFEAIKNSATKSQDGISHKGVLLTDTTGQLQTAGTVLGVPIYLRKRQWLPTNKNLGAGTNSRVLEGQDQTTFKTAAVKEVPLEDFRSLEVVAWAQVCHPNIPKLYGIVREEDIVYLICEEIKDGQQLREFLDTDEYKGMSSEKMLSFVDQVKQQVGSAVKHIHEKGFSHNDVYPKNVIVELDNKKVWLVDLGAALHIEGIKDMDDGVKMDWMCVGNVRDVVRKAFNENHRKRTEDVSTSIRQTKMPPDSVKAEDAAVGAGNAPGLSEAAASVTSSKSSDTSEADNTTIKDDIIPLLQDMRILPKADQGHGGDAHVGPTLEDILVTRRTDSTEEMGKGDNGSG